MKTYTKRRPSRKPKLPENSADVASKRRERCVYDGQRLLGTFIENEKSDLVLAWDPQRRFLGRFRNPKEAARAIGEAARVAEVQKSATKESLEWLNRPVVEFASGLPAELAGGRRRR